MIPKISTKSIPRPKPTDPIGVFDSGVGGLSVLRELRRLMPNERFVFLADQKHVPYGGKTGPQLIGLTSRISRFLLRRRCKAIVVACNTATCYAIEKLRSNFSVPFIGTVPAVKPACIQSKSGTVAVISTPATAKSPALRKLVKQFGGTTRVLRVGCAGLEESVEAGSLRHPNTLRLLTSYLQPIKKAGVDTIVLGCTHYPFLKAAIRRISGARTVDSGRAIARRTKSVLAEAGLLSASARGRSEFFTTGNPAAFTRVASGLLRIPVRASSANI